MMRKPLVMGNWKMNGTTHLLDTMLPQLEALREEVEVALCPPAVFVAHACSTRQNVAIGAQDVSIHEPGAYTGEIAANMLAALGCQYVIVGHSERRQYHHESSDLIAQKAKQALKHDLIAVVCIGESLAEREQGQTNPVLVQQLAPVFDLLSTEELTHIVIAYEPVWAIGTGLAATAEQAQAAHHFIRTQLAQVDKSVADAVRILYGGSVKSQNAAQLFALADVDGGLIGGASLKPDEFVAVCQAAID